MRILLIHARRFKYRAVEKALKNAEDLGEMGRGYEASNALVAFVAVESSDAETPSRIASRAAEEIMDVYGRVGATQIILYPYAHLSSDLASPRDALRVLEAVEEKLEKKGMTVHRAPFGWYKEFLLECYGHPLSELSRTITAAEEPEAQYYVYEPGKGLEALEERPGLLAGSEDRVARRAAEFCAKFGCRPEEPWMIRGAAAAMIRLAAERAEVLLTRLVDRAEIIDAGCAERVCRGVSRYGSLFPRREWRGPLLARLMLGPGECRDRDLGMVRPARLRGVWTSIEKGEEAAFLEKALKLALEAQAPWLDRSSLVAVIDVGEGMLGDQALDNVLEALGIKGVVRAWSSGGMSLSLEVFWWRKGLLASLMAADMAYRRRGETEVLLRIPRSLEDMIYLYMAKAALDEAAGRTPTIPLWLSPVQARIIPVSPENREYAERVASMLRGEGFRTDVDLSGGLGKRIRRAGSEWIPFIVVVGSREEQTGTVNVRIRAENRQVSMRPQDLVEVLRRTAKGASP